MDFDEVFEKMARFESAGFIEFYTFMTPRIKQRLISWALEPEDADDFSFRFVRQIAVIVPSRASEIREIGFEAWLKIQTRDTFVEYWKVAAAN